MGGTESFDALRKKALTLPASPGVYLFSDRAGKIIYIGKAKQLKNRVSQYFQTGRGYAKSEIMVSKAHSLDYIVTGDELEALILECSLIKRHQPKYNILLKDDKGYPFIRLDLNEAYPRFEVAPVRADDGARYFGPYGGRTTAFAVIDGLSAALSLPICSRKFPRDIGKERPCLHYQTGRCYGPCRAVEPPEKYRALIGEAVMLLEGKFSGLLEELKEKMEAAAEELDFERAAAYRDRIAGISKLSEKQNILTGGKGQTDIIAEYAGAGKLAVAVLSLSSGAVAASDVNVFSTRDRGELSGILPEFIKQYYPGRPDLPDKIIVPRRFPDAALLEALLSSQKGKKLPIVSARGTENRSLLLMAYENAKHELLRSTTPEEKTSYAARELAALLGSEKDFGRIEAYDISNTGNFGISASMAVFTNGKPDKDQYRRFSIRSTEGQDDYSSMREVVSRRFITKKEGQYPDPDLVLIDGGLAHVRAAARIIEEAGLAVPVFGMVKDSKHKTRGLVSPDGAELGFDRSPAAFSLVAAIQDEAHRFALAYHSQKRRASLRVSALEGIPGIGPARRAALYKAFRSQKKIAAAELSELEKILPKDAARAVYEHFHGAPDDGGRE